MMIKRINLLYAIFIILGVRAGVYGASIGDALFLMSIVGYAGYMKWLESKETPDYKALFQQDLQEMNNKISSILVKESTKSGPQPVRKFF